MAPERDHPGNRLEHHLYDALGRVRFSVLRVSVEAGQSRYQVTEQELNALGQTVSSTSYATAVALDCVQRGSDQLPPSAAATRRGTGSRASSTTWPGARSIALQAVTVEGRSTQVPGERAALRRVRPGGRQHRLCDGGGAECVRQGLDRRCRAARSPTQTSDRVSAVAYDALGQAIYSVRVLGPGSHQVVKQEL